MTATLSPMGVYLQKVVPLLQADRMQVRENVQKIESAGRGLNLRFARFWLPVLAAILLPGLSGAGILIALLVLRIV